MEIVDAARLKRFHAEHPELVSELVELFATTTPPILDELRRAASDENRAVLGRSAHQLRGGSLNVGANRLAELAHEIEIAQSTTPAQLEALERVFEETRDALRAAIGCDE